MIETLADCQQLYTAARPGDNLALPIRILQRQSYPEHCHSDNKKIVQHANNAVWLQWKSILHIYLDALLLVRALRLEVGFVIISTLNTQEAVGGVSNTAGQHTVPQHGINNCAFPITGPKNKQNNQGAQMEPNNFLKSHLL